MTTKKPKPVSKYLGKELKVIWEDIASFQDKTIKQVAEDTPLQFVSYGVCRSDTKRYLIVALTAILESKDINLETDEDLIRIPKRSINEIT